MPLYEYYCSECQAITEVLRPMRLADDAIQCAHCGSDHTARTLSMFAAISAGGSTIPNSGGGCGSYSGDHCSHCSR